MSEKAHRLIAENLETKNTSLDLSDCYLAYSGAVSELAKCVHLTDLNLYKKSPRRYFFFARLNGFDQFEFKC